MVMDGTGPRPLNLDEWRQRVDARYNPDADRVLEPDDAELASLMAETDKSIAERRWHQHIPQRFHRARLSDFVDSPFYAAVEAWSTDPHGANLVIAGPTGSGKSHLAIAACRPAHFFGLEVKFTPIVTLLDVLRPGGPDDAMDDLVDVDRLIIDDVGIERPSDWTVERIGALINNRWLEQRPTIATTNLDPDALQRHLSPYAFSRLVGSGALRVRLVDSDRRQP